MNTLVNILSAIVVGLTIFSVGFSVWSILDTRKKCRGRI